MCWHNAFLAQRLMPRGEASMSVAPKGLHGLAASRLRGIDRAMGGCRC